MVVVEHPDDELVAVLEPSLIPSAWPPPSPPRTALQRGPFSVQAG